MTFGGRVVWWEKRRNTIHRFRDSTVFDPEACDELDSTELAEVSRAAQT